MKVKVKILNDDGTSVDGIGKSNFSFVGCKFVVDGVSLKYGRFLVITQKRLTGDASRIIKRVLFGKEEPK